MCSFVWVVYHALYLGTNVTPYFTPLIPQSIAGFEAGTRMFWESFLRGARIGFVALISTYHIC